jgi:ankyrin repeat protein
MKKTALFLLPLVFLFSCASLPKGEQDAYDKLRGAIIANDFPAMERIFAGTDAGVVRRIINKKDRDGNTPLHLAVASARTAMTEALLKNGADPNIANKNRQTPLHIAAQGQYQGIADLLLKYRANKNLRDAQGKTPLDYAFETKNTELVMTLNSSGPAAQKAGPDKAPQPASPAASGSPDIQAEFLTAIERDDVDSVRTLIATGKVDMDRAVPGAGSRRAMPILLWAIDTNRSFSIITELVEYYTDPLDEIVDRDGRNAWYYATLRNNARVQSLLRQKGIDTANAANTQN